MLFSRALLFTLLCLGLAQTAPAQGMNLSDQLGFNKPCPVAAAPINCSGPLVKVNTGTCFTYACGTPTDTSAGQQCPALAACPPGMTTTRVEGFMGGCPSITCEPAASVCPQVAACAPGTTSTAIKLPNGCASVRCDKAVVCPQVAACAPGMTSTPVTLPNGCESVRCDKAVVCPQVAACAPGMTMTKTKLPNGCDSVKCEKPAVVCPAVAACAPGFTMTQTKLPNGCASVKCEAPKVKAVQCPKINFCPGWMRGTLSRNAAGCPVMVCVDK